MSKRQLRLTGFFLPIMLVGITMSSIEALAQKAREAVLTTPPSLSLTAEPVAITVCPGDANVDSSKVQLNAKAITSSSSTIRYRWRASGGRIEGTGATATWDLAGLSPGYYKAFVEITEIGADEEECEAFSSTTVFVSCPPPFCPNVAIICPDRLSAGQPLTFRSTTTGGSPNVTPVYNWTVSAGKIIEGQGTNSITVETSGLAGQTITATLSMGGYNLDCSATCAVGIPIPLTPARRFDEFPEISRNDEKARLDNYAIELQNDPTSTAYVIVYGGQRTRSGDVRKHLAQIVDYLVNTRGIDESRLVTVAGPTRTSFSVELWIAPQGAVPPKPTP